VTTKRPIDLELTEDEERILAAAFRENHEVTQRYMGQLTKGPADPHTHNEALLKEGISTGVLRAFLEVRGHNATHFAAEYQPDSGTVRITKKIVF
jgi:hypothetical protein